MANFKRTILTQGAHALIAKLVAKTSDIEFTRVCISNHDYSMLEDNELELLTEIEDIKQEDTVGDVEVINNATVKVHVSIENIQLKEGYYAKTIALYANDAGEEILYSVTTALIADYIPPFNGTTNSTIVIDLLTVVSNAEEVTIEINPSAHITVETFNKFKDNVNSQLVNYQEQLSKKFFVAHRGYWTGTDNLYTVENSIEALRESIKNGFNGMECDLRKDVNGKIVLMHDETVDRTTSSTGKIKELDYSRCILLDKGGNANELGATIPLLEDIIKIASYEQDFWLVIDGGKNVVTASEIKTLCDKYNYYKIIYENFDLATVKALDQYAYTLNTITDFSEINLKNLEQYLPNVYLALTTVSDINSYSDTIKAHGFGIEGYAYESTLNGTYLAMINDTTISNKIDMFVSEVTKDRGYKNSVFKSYSTAPKLYKSIKDIIPTYIGTSGSTSISDVIAAMDEYSVLFTKLSSTLDSILYPAGFSTSGIILQIQKVDAYGAYVTMVDRYSNYGYIRHGVWSSTSDISYYTVSNKITSYNYLVSIPNFSTSSTTLLSLISLLPPYAQVQSILSKSWACCPAFIDSTGAFITIKKTDINVAEIWITPRNTDILNVWKGFWNGTNIVWIKFTGTLQS